MTDHRHDTDTVSWRKIEERFSELRWVVENTVLETREMALGHKTSNGWKDGTPYWDDDDIGVSVKSWMVIPYQDGIDQTLIDERINVAKRIARQLEPLIQQRVASPEFALLWGRFCECAGGLQLLYFGETSDMHAARASAAKSVDEQRKWIALHLIIEMDAGALRKDAEATVFLKLKHFLKAGKFPPNYGYAWFGKMVRYANERPQGLMPTYTIDGKFTADDVEAFRGASLTGIPPLLP